MAHAIDALALLDYGTHSAQVVAAKGVEAAKAVAKGVEAAKAVAKGVATATAGIAVHQAAEQEAAKVMEEAVEVVVVVAAVEVVAVVAAVEVAKAMEATTHAGRSRPMLRCVQMRWCECKRALPRE